MATRPAALVPLLTRLPSADADGTPATDRELLRRFARDQDEAAFAILTRRHGPMVLAACRRVLGNPADAEDACQATFLVLARKAGSARWRPSVAGWLYATARRVATNARTARTRRTKHEGKAPAKAPANPLAEITGEELLAILDDELGRLPERYRGPVVLCCLEGRTRDEAARQLGVPVATLKGQLERGRRRLHAAVAKRGVTLGAGLLVLLAASPAAAVPARVVSAVVAAARGAAVNATGVKAVLLAAAVVGVAVLGVGAVQPPAGKDKAIPAKAAAKPAERPGRTYAGRVVGPGDKPVAGATVFAFEAAERDPQTVRATTGDAGGFRITLPADKKFGRRLFANAAGFGIGRAENLGEAGDDLTIRLVADNPVSGRVVTTEGNPVAGVRLTIDRIADDVDDLNQLLARVKAGSERDGPGYRRSMPTARAELGTTAVTDAAGKFRLAGGGKDRILYVDVRGDGIVATRLTVINRPGFDPEPFNAAARKAGNRFDARSVLHGPDLNIVAEREKVIRGRVTDAATGKPRAGVQVLLTRSRSDLLLPIPGARTDKDGRYEIRGARKARGYMVEIAADTAAGYMPCQAWADDTTGYEPVSIDLRVKKGVVVTGRIIDKGTGKAVQGWALIGVPQGNPSLKDYPEFNGSAWLPMQSTDADGRFRVVAIPGPVLLFGQPNNADFPKYKPPAADPKYPQFFKKLGDHWAYYMPGGALTPLQGRFCKVLEIRAGAGPVEQDIELEPVEIPKKP